MKTIKINDVEYVEKSELLKIKKATKAELPKDGIPFEIGGEYFFRTVTYHLTGRLINIVGQFIILEDAAWIPDSGRFNKFFTDPTNELEVEPFGDRQVRLNINTIVDATERKILVEVR